MLQHLGDFKGKWGQTFTLSDGGQVLYGGLLLAIPSLVFFCRMAHLPTRRIMDLVVVAAPVGLAIGRLGCFCRGCCYGSIANVPWAVRFPKHIDAFGRIVGSPPYVDHWSNGLVVEASTYAIPVHPAQIYSSAVSLGVFFILVWLWKREFARGQLLLLYLIIYGASRFCLEFIRANDIVFAAMTLPQIVSMIVALIGSVATAVSYRTRRTPSIT